MVAALVCWFFGPYYDDFPSIYYNNLFYDQLSPVLVMEGRGRRRAFG
jgi:hypothetical protein